MTKPASKVPPRIGPFSIWDLNRHAKNNIPTERAATNFMHWYMVISSAIPSQQKENVFTAIPLCGTYLNGYSFDLLKKDYGFLEKDCYIWCDHPVTLNAKFFDDFKGEITSQSSIDAIKALLVGYLDLL